MYTSLNAELIVETAGRLHRRIAERFPDSSLRRVAGELLGVAEKAAAKARWLARPHLPLRAMAWACMAAIGAVLAGATWSVRVKFDFSTLSEMLQGLEAGINEAVFLGAAVFFLFTMETRWKRRAALDAMHVLRSIAHIIDMHQLTKDPEIAMGGGTVTDSSPRRALAPFELARYLDYCSELLSIVSKLAALYVQHFNDPVTLSAVNDVEELTNGLSRKIWQKLVILCRSL